jgi:hypothetical protein
MERLTFADIVNHKLIDEVSRQKDLKSIVKYDASVNVRCFAGNKYLYHYQMENLCKTRAKNKPTLFEIMNDDEKYENLYNKAQKLDRSGTLANRLFEAERFNSAVVFFKPTTAKYIYQKFGAKQVLDPTAGWGGRMLGAYALNIGYTGIDTNTNLKAPYDKMIAEMGKDNLNMIWGNALDVDFSKIEYDFVLTSPPYINIEVYENMKPFESDKMYYVKFLIPLIEKCLLHIKSNGWVCFNISPQMYEELMSYGFRPAEEQHDLLQQKRMGKDKQDKIYCWKSQNPKNGFVPTKPASSIPNKMSSTKNINYKKKMITFQRTIEYVLDYTTFCDYLDADMPDEARLVIWEKMCKATNRSVKSDEVMETENHELVEDLIGEAVENAE